MEYSTSAFSADRHGLDSSAIRTPDSGSAPLHPDASGDSCDSLAVLRAALASSLSGVAVCDRFRRILLTNAELDTLFGYAAGELLRRDIATIAPEATFSSATIRELDGLRKDGTTIPIKVSITPAAAHEPLFIVSVLDVSERRRLETKHQALSNLAMRCAAAPNAQLCDTLDQEMRTVADALAIDRCAAYLPTEDGTSISLIWRWERTTTANLPDDFDASQALPWTMNRTRDGEVVCVTAIDEIPNLLDRESMRNLGAASYAAVPLTVSGVRGTLIVDTGAARTWPGHVVEDVRLLASVISQMLTRLESPRSDGRDEPGRPLMPSRQDGPVLRREVGTHTTQMIVSESFVIRNVLQQVHQVAPTTATVLLLGETGVGKEVFAQAIHNLSPRQRRPMIRISCAAIPSALIESELFGRERGAFTGALSRQIGRFEAAHGSTIFLDEIGELPLEIQVKLLRVLQERTVERLGGNQSVKVDVRVIAATNRNLEEAVSNGTLPRGSVLPAERLPDHDPAAARSHRGHPQPRLVVHRRVLEHVRQEHRLAVEGEPRAPCSATAGRATSASSAT